jgi:amidohydrolase
MLDLARSYFGEIQTFRRHLHAYPELSFEETNTAKYIAEQLQGMDIPFQMGVGGHGIVAHIYGQMPGTKTVALRADMDALPIQETNDTPYKSQHAGVMHACGHDVHTASLLGAAYLLQAQRNRFGGTVRLLFQPAEEKLPGGASLMIRDGALLNPVPSAIFGQHVYPSMEAGKVGFRAGQYMASADEIYVSITGKGGHAALPQSCIDPILISAQVITALQSICSRFADPFVPSVLTLGKIQSVGGATNIIPSVVKIEGTLRTMDEKWRTEAHRLITQIIDHTTKSMGGTAEVNIVKGYPVLHNDTALTQKAMEWATKLLGNEHVELLPMRMTAEDFAWYTHVIPGCFYRLGTGNVARGITSPVHTSTFDIDEAALPIGAAMMAHLAIEQLLS